MRLITSLFIIMLSFSAHAEAQYEPEVYPTNINSCSSWSYSADARGYVCNGYPRSLSVVDYGQVQRLEARIQALESKLLELQSEQ